MSKSQNTGHLFSTFDQKAQDGTPKASGQNENQNKLIGRRANIIENQNSREEAMKEPVFINKLNTPISSILNSVSGANTPRGYDEFVGGSRPASMKSSRR